MMEAQLCRLGLEYEIVTATNGHSLTAEELAVRCDPDAIAREPEWLSLGAIGCALSHSEAQRRIVEQQLPVAVILEDDLLLPDDFGTLLAGIESVMEPDGLTLLFWLSNEIQPFRQQTKIELSGERTLAISADPERLLSAVGYVLTSSVAARLVELNRPVRVTADSWGYFYANRAVAEIGCLIPSPITLANFPSDIRYGRQRGLRLVKRWMEEHLPFIQRLSASRRDRYFRTRTRHHWI